LRNTTLKRWLAGEVPPQLSRLASIAELTGVSHAVHVSPDEMLELRRALDTLVASVDWPVLTVVMPDELLSSGAGVIESDRIADVAMLAAVDVWTHLRNWRFVPAAICGRLASMFDARGRPMGDPRLSMVRAYVNMPRKR
jgi:hypothetical protein